MTKRSLTCLRAHVLSRRGRLPAVVTRRAFRGLSALRVSKRRSRSHDRVARSSYLHGLPVTLLRYPVAHESGLWMSRVLPKANPLLTPPSKLSYASDIQNQLSIGMWRRLVKTASVVQYWSYYLYNDWENKHEGDWESVQVDIAGFIGPGLSRAVSPLRWFYSAHGRGTVGTCASPDACLNTKVYVARGSHAGYFEQGEFDVEAY